MRADVRLVEMGLVRSRHQAKELISIGRVELQVAQDIWRAVNKPSEEVAFDASLRILTDTELLRFVSRAGVKLSRALQKLNLSVEGFSVLDVGQSTGGFTDCLLQNRVHRVVGIEVGFGQLDKKIRCDERVQVLEKFNAKRLETTEGREAVFAANYGQFFDLVVVDVSFISLTVLGPGLVGVLKPGGHLLALVKPQFELGPASLDKKGVVRDPSFYPLAEAKIMASCQESALYVENYFSSSFPGRDGNQEFFVYARRR